MNKLLIIDGSGLLVANYYGTLADIDANDYSQIPQINNLYTNAIFPTIKQIFDIAINYNATHLCVAFDKSRNTFRKKLCESYKANRKETPEPLKQQFETCEKVLNKLGIFTICSDEYEADDYAGSIAKQYNLFFDEIKILTKDKDYLQLVDEKITVWMMLHSAESAQTKLEEFLLVPELGFNEYLPSKVFPYTPQTVFEDKGVQACNFNEVLALVGDKADNIKGVTGISENVAAKLIKEYNTIEDLYEEIEHANYTKKAKELREYWKNDLKITRSPLNALELYRNDAFLSLELATIKTDIDLSQFSFYDLEIAEKFKYYSNIHKQNGFDTFRTTLYKEIRKIIFSL